jgi:hypothetical protein
LRIGRKFSLEGVKSPGKDEGRPDAGRPSLKHDAAGLYDQPSAPPANGCRAALYLDRTSSTVGVPLSARAIDYFTAV